MEYSWPGVFLLGAVDVRGGFSPSCCSTTSFQLVFVFFTNLAVRYMVYFVSFICSIFALYAVLTGLLKK